MPNLTYAKHERIWLKSHPELTEKWLQDLIGDDPSVLGLGDLVLKDRERIQPRAGRLDLLLQDVETAKRYEVEIQLGKTDEAHIIRTIEYWDLERKRYPQYEHAAVLVAEDITSRFLNVISLFHGSIPLIAIQLHAVRLGDQISLVFTRVLDEMPLGLVDDDEAVAEVTDRAYWDKRSSKPVLAIVDEIYGWVRGINPVVELKYNKFYIGLAIDGRPSNFVTFRPRKDFLWLRVRLEQSEETQARLDEAGLESKYSPRWGYYEIRLSGGDPAKHHDLIVSLMAQANGDAE